MMIIMRWGRPWTSVQSWHGVRSEYSWLPPTEGSTTTKPKQIGISFSAHRRLGYRINGHTTRLAVPAGAVFATNEAEAHWLDVTEHTEALEIYPDLAALEEVVDPARAGSVDIEPTTAGWDATLLAIATQFRRIHVNGTKDAMVTSTVAHRLLTHVADHYALPRRPSPSRRAGHLDKRLVDRLAQFVDDRLGEPLTLDDLAREACLSTFHLARSFKNTTGMTPHEFVTARRLHRAVDLLLHTKLSVPELAYAVGYTNLSHFRRLFRRHVGATPAHLRAPRPDLHTPVYDGPDTARSDPPQQPSAV